MWQSRCVLWMGYEDGPPVFAINFYCVDPIQPIQILELRQEQMDGSSKLMHLEKFDLTDPACVPRAASRLAKRMKFSQDYIAKELYCVRERIWDMIRAVPSWENTRTKYSVR